MRNHYCIMFARTLFVSVLGWSLLGAANGGQLDEFIHYFETLHLKSKFSVLSKDKLVSHFIFRAHGRDFSVHVQTHTALFHPDFHIQVRAGGEVINKTMDTRHIVTGQVEGELDSAVHGHILNDTFIGAILSQGETYYIEPLVRYLPESPHFNQVIYKASDVHYNLEHNFCSSEHSPKLRRIQESATHIRYKSPPNLLRKRRAIDPDKNTCLIKVVADYEFFSVIGNSQESTTIEEITSFIMQADSYYRRTNFVADEKEFSGFGIALHSAEIITVNSQEENPYFGTFSVEDLLDAFSVTNFNDVCLGHLFTYRDFQGGVIGLAYLGDPNGARAGGICQQRTNTIVGERNLNTGLTSLNNQGRRLPRIVTSITLAHEIGHNHGSEHDPPGECTPGGSEGNFIMFASATNGNQNNNQQFSQCSREAIGATISSSGGCFQQAPSTAECGNGIVEGDEECDCGSDNDMLCREYDPCCTPGNCTLLPTANCSAIVSSCCNASTCQAAEEGTFCLRGDDCQEDSTCMKGNPDCPVAPRKDDGTPCNNGENVCEDGLCVGSPCPLFNESEPCYCTEQAELCHVCCIFPNGDGSCISTFNIPEYVEEGIFVQSGYPCKNLTGYCRRDESDPTASPECITVDDDNPLDILFDLSSITEWIKSNWYWVVGGFVALAILIVLLHVTYRRKKPKEEGQQQGHIMRRQKNPNQTYGYYQNAAIDEEQQQLETSGLLTRDHITTRT